MVRTIDNTDDLKKLFSDSNRNFYIYGAGYQGTHLLKYLRFNISLRPDMVYIKSMLVTRKEGNPSAVGGIPVIQFDKSDFDKRDCIIIAVDEGTKGEVAEYLKECKAELIDINTGIIRYEDVYNRIKPFGDNFPDSAIGLNRPSTTDLGRTVWSCWWQGEENAPALVKSCWKSQKENLPEDVRHMRRGIWL